jgi:hypothetical protein
MVEHTFVVTGDIFRDDARATELAAALAERLLDEISRAKHSWRAIETMAANLARIASAMVKLETTPPRAPPPDP